LAQKYLFKNTFGAKSPSFWKNLEAKSTFGIVGGVGRPW